MLNDLLPISMASIRSFARHVLWVGAVLFVIGLTGIGTARTIDRRSGSPKADEPGSAGTTELMHDVNAAEEIHPSLSMPETITAIHRSRVIMMEVTAYCACPRCCGPNAKGITASGKMIDYNGGRFVAADTSLLPFGTRLMIPGYDTRPVEVIDKGGAIKGNKLDVFFASHSEALKWGRQRVPVTVVE